MLDKSPISTANDELCSSILNVLAAALMKYRQNGSLYQVESGSEIDKLFDNIVHYMSQGDAEKFFNL